MVLSQELDAWQVSLPAGAHTRRGLKCVTCAVCAAAGGHAPFDLPAGAAEGGGEEEGRPGAEGKRCRTPKEQIFETEGRENKRFLLLLQRQVESLKLTVLGFYLYRPVRE